MGFTVYAPRQDGNARFGTLQVQLTESSSITRVVVADGNGKFFYSTGGGGGIGSVTSVSVANANGLSGSVVNPTTTPVITLSTTVTGILKGDGTSIFAATPGTDYITPTQGTASYAQTASYALNANTGSLLLTASANNTTITFTKGDGSTFDVTVSQSGSVATASYALFALNSATASYIDPNFLLPKVFQIVTGSVSASVNVSSQNLFLINSGSTEYFNISSSGNTDLYSNLFMVRNFITKQPVLIVSQSIVQIATQSIDPTGTTNAGSLWFTSSSFYVGLD